MKKAVVDVNQVEKCSLVDVDQLKKCSLVYVDREKWSCRPSMALFMTKCMVKNNISPLANIFKHFNRRNEAFSRTDVYDNI